MKKLSLLLASAMLLLAVQGCSDSKDENACDSLDFQISCDGSILSYCDLGDASGTTGSIATTEMYCNNGQLTTCEAGEIVVKSEICDDGDILYCNSDGEIARDSCKGLQCEEYLKGDVYSAECFDKSMVGESCGEITAIGTCSADNQLTFCSKKEGGKLLTISCTARDSQCMHIEDSYGYDCAIQCQREDDEAMYNDFGICDDTTLRYCTQNGVYAESDCNSLNKVCDFGGRYYQCI